MQEDKENRMVKFLISMVGAILFAARTALILIALGMDTTRILYYAICGVAGGIGYPVFGLIYTKLKKSKL